MKKAKRKYNTIFKDSAGMWRVELAGKDSHVAFQSFDSHQDARTWCDSKFSSESLRYSSDSGLVMLKIKWGESDKMIAHYAFDTEAEKRAFVNGAYESQGWAEYEIL